MFANKIKPYALKIMQKYDVIRLQAALEILKM